MIRRLAAALAAALWAGQAAALSLAGNGTSDLARSGVAAFTAPPATICAWVETTNAAVLQNVAGVFASGSASTNFMRLGVTAAGAIQAASNDGASNTATVGTITANTWHHACAVFASTTSRTAYLDGTAGSTSTASNSPSGINRTSILVRDSSTQADWCPCHIAQVAMWTTALDAASIGAMALGVSPRRLHPEALALFAPYLGIGAAVLDWRGNNLALTGTSANASTPSLVQLP
jgi:hypothetical protein